MYSAPISAHSIKNAIEVLTPDEKPTKHDRESWFREAREYKHQFLTKELELNKDQQKAFFGLYDKMQAECHRAQMESRDFERKVYEKGDQATDKDYEQATDLWYESQRKEAEIELKYRSEFKKILSPRQMFKLRNAERKFTRVLMDRHQEINKKPKH